MAPVASPRRWRLISLCRYKSCMLASVCHGTKIAVSAIGNSMSLMDKTKDVLFWAPHTNLESVKNEEIKYGQQYLWGKFAGWQPTAQSGI